MGILCPDAVDGKRFTGMRPRQTHTAQHCQAGKEWVKSFHFLKNN
jgi:hypothetical protein